MSLVKAKELREKRAQLANNARELLDRAEKEKRGLNAEETKSFDGFHTEIEELRSQVDRIEKQDALDRELGESRGVKAGRENRGAGAATTEPGSDEEKEKAEKRSKATINWIRRGFNGLADEERQIMAEQRAEARALSATTGNQGGYSVAPDTSFYGRVTEALLAFGGMRSVATVISSSTGADLPMPTENDTGNEGEIIGENTIVTEQDVAFGLVTIGAFKYSSKLIRVPIELLQDTAFDIGSFLARKMSTRTGRISNRHFTIGSGNGQPNGLVTAATVGVVGAGGQTTSLIVDDLTELEHSVDPSYRLNASYMFHDTTLKAIKKLKDSQGRPLWQAGIAVKAPDTIGDYKYVINQHMPVMAASAKSISYGDHSQYVIRDVMDLVVKRLEERYAEYGQVAFLAFSRHDGDLLDAGTHPVKLYQNAAA